MVNPHACRSTETESDWVVLIGPAATNRSEDFAMPFNTHRFPASPLVAVAVAVALLSFCYEWVEKIMQTRRRFGRQGEMIYGEEILENVVFAIRPMRFAKTTDVVSFDTRLSQHHVGDVVLTRAELCDFASVAEMLLSVLVLLSTCNCCCRQVVRSLLLLLMLLLLLLLLLLRAAAGKGLRDVVLVAGVVVEVVVCVVTDVVADVVAVVVEDRAWERTERRRLVASRCR